MLKQEINFKIETELGGNKLWMEIIKDKMYIKYPKWYNVQGFFFYFGFILNNNLSKEINVQICLFLFTVIWIAINCDLYLAMTWIFKFHFRRKRKIEYEKKTKNRKIDKINVECFVKIIKPKRKKKTEKSKSSKILTNERWKGQEKQVN